MVIDKTQFALGPNRYFHEPHAKDLMVLHFTAGSTAAGAVAAFRAYKDPVATAFLVDVDGRVYQLFDPRCWAWHLGLVGGDREDGRHDKRSIGIEIVNVGPLRRRGDELFWWPPANRFQTRYCSIREPNRYIARTYRGFDYYATFTAEQLAAVHQLVPQICREHGIEFRLPPADRREACTPAFFRNFRGVASHQNFRADKFDIGPAFDWEFPIGESQ